MYLFLSTSKSQDHKVKQMWVTTSSQVNKPRGESTGQHNSGLITGLGLTQNNLILGCFVRLICQAVDCPNLSGLWKAGFCCVWLCIFWFMPGSFWVTVWLKCLAQFWFKSQPEFLYGPSPPLYSIVALSWTYMYAHTLYCRSL